MNSEKKMATIAIQHAVLIHARKKQIMHAHKNETRQFKNTEDIVQEIGQVVDKEKNKQWMKKHPRKYMDRPKYIAERQEQSLILIAAASCPRQWTEPCAARSGHRGHQEHV